MTTTFILIWVGMSLLMTIPVLCVICSTPLAYNALIGFTATFLLSALIGLGITAMMFKQSKNLHDTWNDGKCPTCGTEWHFQTAERSNYYYVCEEGHIFKSAILFQK